MNKKREVIGLTKSGIGGVVLSFYLFSFSLSFASIADDRYQVAFEFYLDGEYQESLLQLESALQSDPNHIKAQRLLAIVEQVVKRPTRSDQLEQKLRNTELQFSRLIQEKEQLE